MSIVGVAMTSWIFKKAYNAMLVRREIVDSIWAKLLRPYWSAIVWTAYYVPTLAAIFLLRQDILAFIFGLLATAVFPLFFALKVSFPERLPREGTVVLSALTIYTLGSLIVSLLNAKAAPYLVLWGIFFAVLLWASAHAYKRKPPAPLEDSPNW